MQLHNLSKPKQKKKARRIGRGGKRGTTAGRGTKGQKARAGHRIRPALRDLIKKLPKRRGRGTNKNISRRSKPLTLSWDRLAGQFQAGETVNPESLRAKGLIRAGKGRRRLIKILAGRKPPPNVKIEGCLMTEHVRTILAQA